MSLRDELIEQLPSMCGSDESKPEESWVEMQAGELADELMPWIEKKLAEAKGNTGVALKIIRSKQSYLHRPVSYGDFTKTEIDQIVDDPDFEGLLQRANKTMSESLKQMKET